MFILVIGAKGGVGTTSLAVNLARETSGVGLDLADGQLAAQLERKAWALSGLAFSAGQQRQRAIDRIVKHRISLLWTPECNLAGDAAWKVARAVADRSTLVADGGIGEDPAPQASGIADVIVIVTVKSEDGKDNPVARHHEARLQEQYPTAAVIRLDLNQSRNATRNAARELAAKLT